MLNVNWDLKNQPLKFLTAVNESIKNDSPTSDEFYELFFENPDKEDNNFCEYLHSLVNSDELNEEILDIIFNILFYDSTNIEKTLKEIDNEFVYGRVDTFYEILFYDCFYKLITYPFDNQKTELIFEKHFYNEERQQVQFIDPFNWIEYKDPQVFIAQVTKNIIDWCDVSGILFLIRFFKEKNKDVYLALINAFNRLDLSKIFVDSEFFVAPFEDTIKEINTTKTLSIEEKAFVDKLKSTLELYK